MNIILHPTKAEYEKEYAAVRGALIARGTSLNQWLKENGFNRQLATRALRGMSCGRKSLEARCRILRMVLEEGSQP